MTYLVQNNTAFIDGNSGYYDNYIQNPSVRYGRNAANNNKIYTGDLSFKDGNMPPLEFEYRYMPASKPSDVDTAALMAVSFEEMNAKTAIAADEISRPIKEVAAINAANAESNNGALTELANTLDSRVIDLNNDGVIDLAEYSTTVLASDMLSKSDELNLNNITGIINNTGSNKAPGLMNINHANNTRRCLQYIYDAYNLGAAQNQFLSNTNNTLDIRG